MVGNAGPAPGISLSEEQAGAGQTGRGPQVPGNRRRLLGQCVLAFRPHLAVWVADRPGWLPWDNQSSSLHSARRSPLHF